MIKRSVCLYSNFLDLEHDIHVDSVSVFCNVA